MRATAIAGIAALTVGLTLSGCGAQTRTIEGTARAADPSPQPAPRTPRPRSIPQEKNSGTFPTIADYINDNGIEETTVQPGMAGAPVIDLPFPDGWEDAGADTPEWAYGAMVYTGPESADYTPSIVALVSRLDGDVDPQAILDVAGGELQNLPGYQGWTEGSAATLGGFPAFQLGGTWVQDGLTKIVAQKTVVIGTGSGLHVLQLNADGLEEQAEIIGAATDVIDAETAITP